MLLQWHFEQHGGAVVDRVRVDDDGAVTRLLTHPAGGAAPELGWWSGTFAETALAAARGLAEQVWASPAGRPPPDLAGRWIATRGDGAQLALDDPSSDLAGSLSAVRAAVLDAASHPVRVARFTCRWGSVGDEQVPLLDVASTGAEPITVRVAAEGAAAEAAFLNDDAEALGFLGDPLVLAPSSHAFAVVRMPVDAGWVTVAGQVAGGEVFASTGPGSAPAGGLGSVASLGPPGDEQVAIGVSIEVAGPTA
jgi:hypothetical protein